MNIYWGDLHNHCGITYGFGGLENALAAAREQLDFCAVIGHAMWPDMPEREKDLEFLIDFHEKGFKKLACAWEQVRETIKNAHIPHEFVTFQGYEMHSRHYGDHHLLSPSDELPLVYADSPQELAAKLAPAPVIVVPHHVGYTPGYRGGNWDTFNRNISPIVEVFSKHGCSISDRSTNPYYHDMGPRDSRNTIHAALQQGLRFGFIGSTDHHAGYPGSYGDGRVAVLAKEKTREALWEALLARRTYAITGDKIQCDFRINGAWMGSEIQDPGNRKLALDVTACDSIDKITIFKNSRPWKIINGQACSGTGNGFGKYKIRIEMGWGKSPDGYVWNGNLQVKDGKLLSVETCFRGQSVLAPTPEMREDPDINKLDNKLLEKTDASAKWICTSFKNPTTLHPQTSALIVEIEGNPHTLIEVEANGIIMELSIQQLLKGSVSKHLLAYNSEAILIHRAVHESEYTLIGEWEDGEAETDSDYYYVEVRQGNSQFAWTSPIYITQ